MAEAFTFGLDLSHHQGSFDLARAKREGIAFVILKATEGGGYVDDRFAANLAAARKAGLLVAAYHYQRDTSAAMQSVLVARTVPRDVPVILDVESGSGNLSVTRAIISDLRASGYRVPLLYLPRWYWQQIGSPSLAGLPPLWSSRYPDNVVGSIGDEFADVPASYWQGYGGLPVKLLQFTSSAAIAGRSPIDANAFRGTRAQLAALLGGEVEDDMQLDDKLPPVKMADGNLHTLTVADVLHGMAQYMGGNGAAKAPLTNHPMGQYTSRILAIGDLTDDEAKILAAVKAGDGGGGEVDVDSLAAALVEKLGPGLGDQLVAAIGRALSNATT